MAQNSRIYCRFKLQAQRPLADKKSLSIFIITSKRGKVAQKKQTHQSIF